MPDSEATMQSAVAALRAGGVIAYPTEAVYGLGCDPYARDAFDRILALKQRPAAHGVLLIGADIEQIEQYIDRAAIDAATLAAVYATWPGPQTWVLPRARGLPNWLAGKHAGIALRVTAHPSASALCRAFGGALVSTSANLHGQRPARSVADIESMFAGKLDAVLDGPVGDAPQPTSIHDALTGAIIRN